MNGEDSQYFDVPVPDSYIQESISHPMHQHFVDNDPIKEYFKGENSKEFYCGMIAGFRAALSLLQSMPSASVKDDITAATLFVTHLASKK